MTESKLNNDNTEPSYYVAVGASAGGLEALQEFFINMPVDSGLAFIVIQHLSPDFKSVMDELLARCTKMPVLYAVDGAKVEPNYIYLIPPRKSMMIAEGKLLLTDQMPHSGLSFPIDVFFRALAEDQHHRSVGVVLSGTGSDGSRGILAIKEVGGLVMVQEPSNAKFDGMPYSAMKTGVADVVSDANHLPVKLIQFVNHPMIRNQEKSLIRQVEDNDASFQEIFKLLRERSDIDFTQYKATTVARRIERRIGVHGLNTLKEYYALLLKHPQEIQTLAKDMLIGVTRFFRDDEAFSELEKKVIPNILKSVPPGEAIRVWVAGCSTGEEAYSIAILFDEAINLLEEPHQIKIFATDVDPDAIAEASTGQFNLNVRDDISEKRVAKYFKQEEDHLTISPRIRQMVVFATHNLIKDPPFSNTHLAICRNVLIYFQQETQKRVLSMLHFSLRKNGFLFLGCSESLGLLQKYFETIHERSRIYKKSITTRLMLHPINAPSQSQENKSSGPNIEHLLRKYQSKQKHITDSPVIRQLIEDYVPACIILDQNLEIRFAFGDVTPYTQKYKSGAFSANINDVIVKELSTPISTSVHRAISEKTTVFYKNIDIEKSDGGNIHIDLRVCYIESKPTESFNIAIIFQECSEPRRPSDPAASRYDANSMKQQHIIDLETELQKSKEYLQVTVEELETTNEELQSSNEELLAANEELQSTNEELQSVNEELYTVNSEYQEKIEEVTSINAYLDNIMKSIDIGILFLDEAMLIRNYTPAATRVINLMKTDIGRPFHHISHKLQSDTLLQDIANVIERSNPFEQEIKTSDGRSILLKIVPYIVDNNESQGCVISITDITEAKQANLKISDSYSQIQKTFIPPTDENEQAPLNVLVIENEFATDKIVERLIAGCSNYVIKTCDNYHDAQQLLTKSDFDICLIDFQQGDKNALDLIGGIQNTTKLPPFIMYADLIDKHFYESAKQLGIYDILSINDLTTPLLERSIHYITRLKALSSMLSGTD